MLLLGIDIGTSSIKVSVVDAGNGAVVAQAQFPDSEREISSPQPGWAEQDPQQWWNDTCMAIQKANAGGTYRPKDIGAIGIAYQMHGLVVLDADKNVLRPAVIWCDSRAVNIGEKAFAQLGQQQCLSSLLNSPGNFTGSKLAWVKANEPTIYANIRHVMLPGDYIAQQLTGEITTSASALSEGILWDFQQDGIADSVLDYFGFDKRLFPAVQPVFSTHGKLTANVANALGLTPGIPVTYKAGDQPNNALSLQVLDPGEVAATAGTSGVIYGVSDALTYDPQSRVNSFAHVNHNATQTRVGVLLCINGTGILNSFVKQNLANGLGYPELNAAAATVEAGSEGLAILPFGNGAERMLGNRTVGAHFTGIDLNRHKPPHIFRAVQEGIACAFRYGLDIMRENGMQPSLVRAGKSNMFLSHVFTEAFVNTTGLAVELYHADGSVGAAIGAGIGAGMYASARDAFANQKPIATIEPQMQSQYEEVYTHWLEQLHRFL